MSKNASEIAFSTGYKYFLNYSKVSKTQSFSGASVASLAAKSYTMSIPVKSVKNFSQIQINFSFDSSNWRVYPLDDIAMNGSFKMATTGKFSGSNYVLTFYAINNTGSTATSPNFTVKVSAYLFIEPV